MSSFSWSLLATTENYLPFPLSSYLGYAKCCHFRWLSWQPRKIMPDRGKGKCCTFHGLSQQPQKMTTFAFSPFLRYARQRKRQMPSKQPRKMTTFALSSFFIFTLCQGFAWEQTRSNRKKKILGKLVAHYSTQYTLVHRIRKGIDKGCCQIHKQLTPTTYPVLFRLE